MAFSDHIESLTVGEYIQSIWAFGDFFADGSNWNTTDANFNEDYIKIRCKSYGISFVDDSAPFYADTIPYLNLYKGSVSRVGYNVRTNHIDPDKEFILTLKPTHSGDTKPDTSSKQYRCIVCDTTIRTLDNDFGLIDDGIVGKIGAGYGSSHDMDSFEIAVCDSCLTKKVVSGAVRYFEDGES